MKLNTDERYLITGGTGFLGFRLVEHLFKEGYTNLRIMARREAELFAMQENFSGVGIVPGDVADPFSCKKACKDIDGVFHLASFKHVRMAELQTFRCIQSNLIGTMNLLDESLQSVPRFFVFVSTDKAAKVNGVYGATKFLSEKLVEEYREVNKDTDYRIIRYGNIWGSTGSIGKRWPEQIAKKGKVNVTAFDATRYFLTVEEAIMLILDTEGDVIPRRLKSASMRTVVEAFYKTFGDFGANEVGLQAGENLHETIDGKVYSDKAEQYTVNEFKEKFLCHTR